MSGGEIAAILTASGTIIGVVLGGVAAIQTPIRKRLDAMDKAREEAKAHQADAEKANAQVHRTILCGQIAMIKGLREVYPQINGKVKEYQERYEVMLEYDCPPPPPN